MGALGDSTLAGADNCFFDNWLSTLERQLKPLFKAANVDFVRDVRSSVLVVCAAICRVLLSAMPSVALPNPLMVCVRQCLFMLRVHYLRLKMIIKLFKRA